MSAALPRRLARLGLILPLALGACRSEDSFRPSSGPLAPQLDVGVVLVTNTNDAGPGSLREALDNLPDDDVIRFDPSLAGQTILLTTGELHYNGGPGAIIGPAGGITISAGRVSPTLFNDGHLTITNVTITGGSDVNGAGSGIQNFGTLLLDHTTVSGNGAGHGSAGGGIWNKGTLTVSNSTISGNDAEVGGGIDTDDAATTTLVNSTVTANQAELGGGLIGPAILRNSIVAGNTAGTLKNCATHTAYVLDGVNLSDDDSCGAADAHMLVVADARLGPLADNGGPTKTHNLLTDSPAIDAATGICTVTDDQRYVARPKGGACDIGAVEFNDYVTLALVIDPSVGVNPKTGVAAVTGSLTCSAATTVPLEVTLSQVQKSRRTTATVAATGTVTVNCSGKSYWSVAMAPPSGAFVNSDASATVKSTGTPKSVTPASRTAAVKLYWGHK